MELARQNFPKFTFGLKYRKSFEESLTFIQVSSSRDRTEHIDIKQMTQDTAGYAQKILTLIFKKIAIIRC
jgi:hypothetical protein